MGAEVNLNDPVDVLAGTIWGEARNQDYEGKVAVACVVRNRVKRPGWWGDDYLKVCLKPFQFSCWNEKDPNKKKIMALTDDGTDAIFMICQQIAQGTIQNRLNDPTNGATHYHTKNIKPKWAEGKTPCYEHGNHVFYNDIEPSE